MTRIAIVARDLIIASRISEAAAAAGIEVLRVDEPSNLPAPSTVWVAFVDWGARERAWGSELVAWLAQAPEGARPRLVVFGPHTDLAAHADARASGIGPMLARSKLVASLPELLVPG